RFNVTIARIMELVNATRKAIDSGCGAQDPAVREAAEAIAISLSLVAPYTAEDMWEKLGRKPAIANAGWPKIDQSLIGADNVIAILQINGKIKDRIEVSPNISNAELEKLARENAEIKAVLIGQDVKKVITVSPKLVNFVI
ncbi:MAG: class I tRNA ligase family protein, partial [Actinomycetota bacterium]|nr:class I tRNA ligase family protein [Actinomycetota bacterium]